MRTAAISNAAKRSAELPSERRKAAHLFPHPEPASAASLLAALAHTFHKANTLSRYSNRFHLKNP